MKFKTLFWGLALSSLAFASAVHAKDYSEIRIGTESGYAPFEFKNPQGEFEGFDIDVGNAICAKLNAKCVWVDQPFDSLIPGLQARKFDLIHASMARTPAREKVIDFTDTLYAIPSQLVAKDGSGLLPTVDSLKGKRVGVLQGSAQEAYARKTWGKSGATIVSYKEQDQTFGDLSAGRLDAALLEKPNAIAGFLDKPEGKGFAFMGEPIVNDSLVENHIAMGMRKGNDELKQDINKAIQELRKEGVIDKFAEKYFKPGEIGLYNAE